MRRLNMVRRLGLALTILWIIGSSIYWGPQLTACGAASYGCDFVANNASGTSGLFWALPANLGVWRMGMAGNALFATLIFPALLWLAIFVVIYVSRWIWAGRRISD